jgi:hypothetical protein
VYFCRLEPPHYVLLKSSMCFMCPCFVCFPPCCSPFLLSVSKRKYLCASRKRYHPHFLKPSLIKLGLVASFLLYLIWISVIAIIKL